MNAERRHAGGDRATGEGRGHRSHDIRRCIVGHTFTGSIHDHVRLQLPTQPGEGLERDRRSEFVLRLQRRRRERAEDR